MFRIQVQNWLKQTAKHVQVAANAKAVFIFLFLFWWVLLAIFYMFPGIDIWASGIYFTQTTCPAGDIGTTCGRFLIAGNPALGVLRDIFFYLPIICGLTLIYRLFRIWPHRSSTDDMHLVRRLWAGLAALILGPGVLVNIVLKEISHRPRPRNTDFFGGNLNFMPAGDFSGACISNCSFISGEAAGAGWLFCYAIFLIPKRYRILLAPPLVAISLLSPAMRLAYGGHYFSDIVLAWIASVTIFMGVLYIFTRTETGNRIYDAAIK